MGIPKKKADQAAKRALESVAGTCLIPHSGIRPFIVITDKRQMTEWNEHPNNKLHEVITSVRGCLPACPACQRDQYVFNYYLIGHNMLLHIHVYLLRGELDYLSFSRISALLDFDVI